MYVCMYECMNVCIYVCMNVLCMEEACCMCLFLWNLSLACADYLELLSSHQCVPKLINPQFFCAAQLDIDASLLLDSLGDSDNVVPVDGCTELLARFLHAGEQWLHEEATSLEYLPKLDADQWSTAEEVKEAAIAGEKELLESFQENPDQQFGGG